METAMSARLLCRSVLPVAMVVLMCLAAGCGSDTATKPEDLPKSVVEEGKFIPRYCPICKKDAPQAFAALRNLMLALMRWLGHTNMAEAIDLYSAQPESALITMGVTTGI